MLEQWSLDCTESAAGVMFKISIVDSPGNRTLSVEGTLVPPWTAELRRVWRDLGHQVEGRKVVIDLRNVTVIGQEGENLLFELMNDGAKFSCAGVLTKHVLKQLARRSRNQVRKILNLTVTKGKEA